jgi:proteasome assembly chaperone (PAC2) family protein
METKGIDIEEIPRLKNPLFIAGFDGWGNALNISKGTLDFLISRLSARPIARLNPDLFYRYDATRPVIRVEEGVLKSYRPPKGVFYCVETEADGRDLVLFRADEPSMGWHRLVDEMYGFLTSLDVKTVISIGSMYDNVLHTERKISSLVSGEDIKALLTQRGVTPVSYTGPSTLHSTIHWEGQKRGIEGASLWCHCPYYIQGTTHFGLLSELGSLLSFLGNFKLDTQSLEENWKKLGTEISELIKKNEELQSVVRELEKTRGKPTPPTLRRSVDPNEKVINLEDFLEPK